MHTSIDMASLRTSRYVCTGIGNYDANALETEAHYHPHGRCSVSQLSHALKQADDKDSGSWLESGF